MKRALTIVLLCISYWSICQVPSDHLKPVDTYVAPDNSVSWTIEVNHVKGNKFEITAICTIYGGRHIASKDQPHHPWGNVFPTRVYLSPRDNIQPKGYMKESGGVRLHKCKANHRCVTDHDRRIYKEAQYKQRFRVKHVRKGERYHVSGILEWRADSESAMGISRKHGFILVFGI